MKMEMVPIQDILKVHYGKALKEDERNGRGSFPVFGSSGLVGSHTQALVDFATIVIGRKGSVGAVTYAPNGGWPIDTTFYIEPIKPEQLDLRYLFYALINANLARHTITTSIPGLNRNDIYRTQIPLPPLAEQQRIAAILDQADALRTKRRAALAKLDTLLQATFRHMFGENDYEYPTIEDLLKDKVILVHKDGNHGSNYPKSHDFEEQGIPFLSAKCIDESGNIESQLIENLNKNKASQLKIGWIERGDVLLAHNASVGKVALYDGRFPRALIGTSLTAFRPDPNRLLPEYLFAALRSPSFQRQLEKNMGQTTRNQVPITAQRRLSIPLPPKSEQAKFAKIAQLIGQQRRKLEDAINACNVLFHSLQQRAFKGEL